MPTPTAPIATADVSFRGVGKDYVSLRGEPVRALSPIDLDIRSESFVAIVGRSGCGKTTLLRLAAGLEAPTSGGIELGGQPVDGAPAAVRYVFQNYGESLLPWRTVGDNVRFGLAHAHQARTGLSKREQFALVEHYLEEVGLGGTASRFPGELSGGMQQRVAIARALASGPRVLLLDEPFSAVDALSRANLQDLIVRIWQEHHLTVLFVTHDIDEALYLADRVVVLGPAGRGIQRDVVVPIDRPRDQVGSREHPEYLRLRREVLELLLG